MTLFGTRTVAQIAIIVRDIERAREHFARLLHTDPPPIVVSGPQEESKMTYRGQPSDGRARLVFFDLDNLQIELIEPFGGPSIWQEHLDQHGESVHHIAFWVKDTEGRKQALAEHGIEETQRGYFTGGMYSYYDSIPQLGVMIELLERFDGQG
jgi:catechol 2,3-dioxygenase-like lactoylglutathione lyase family enzyme